MDDLEQLKEGSVSARHYYGDEIRKIFVGVGLVMLVSLPLFNNLLPVPSFVSIIAILAISIVAGLTSPGKPWTAIVNTGASMIGLAVFEYHAVNAFALYGVNSTLFIINQFFALSFFLALYLSTKTWRGARS